jgi:hypothetical protein
MPLCSVARCFKPQAWKHGLAGWLFTIVFYVALSAVMIPSHSMGDIDRPAAMRVIGVRVLKG